MEIAGKAIELATRALNSNVVINVALGSAFGLLTIRSAHQQNVIKALESERDSLIKSNKAVKKTLWDWKQELYSEAENPKTAIVPLSTLKVIYDDVVPTTNADAGKGGGKSTPSKILI